MKQIGLHNSINSNRIRKSQLLPELFEVIKTGVQSLEEYAKVRLNIEECCLF